MYRKVTLRDLLTFGVDCCAFIGITTAKTQRVAPFAKVDKGVGMNAAQMLLSGTGRFDFSVNETSELCGFSEPLYFSRVFKKRFGCSPSQYAHRFDRVKPKKKGPVGQMIESDIDN